MSNSGLISKNKQSHVAVAEQGQRMRMVEIRDRIYESRVLDLVVAMAVTGKDLVVNQETMELEEVGVLDQRVRADYTKLITNKLISNAQPPKEIEEEPDKVNPYQKWIELAASMKE
jgi:hypothetical protein